MLDNIAKKIIPILPLILLAVIVAGCLWTSDPDSGVTPYPSLSPTASPTDDPWPITVTLSPTLAHEKELPFTDAAGQRTIVKDYEGAKNVTLSRLESFLAMDDTENTTYVMPNYTCVDFAKSLHDRAEAHGIDNALVVVYFSDEEYGHCFNAFQTTDAGLLYIDCTGLTQGQKDVGALPYDGVNYLKNESGLGWMPIVQAESFEYEYYVEKLAKFNAYVTEELQLNIDIRKWNDECIAIEDARDAGTISNADYRHQRDELNMRGIELQKKAFELDNAPEHEWVISGPMGTVCYHALYW